MRSDHWRLAVVCALFAAMAALAPYARAAEAETEVDAEEGETVAVGAASEMDLAAAANAPDFRFTDVDKHANADAEEEEGEEEEEADVADEAVAMLLEEDVDADADADLESALDAETDVAVRSEQAELAEALTDADSELMSEAEAAESVKSEVAAGVAASLDAEELAVAEAAAEGMSAVASTYQEQLAREHVRYSSAAYYTRATDNTVDCLNYWGLSSVKLVKQIEVSPRPGSIVTDKVGAFVGIDNTKSRIIVAFRGTNSPEQLLTEAVQSTRVQLPDCAGGGDCWVMRYFYEATTQLCPVVSPIVRQLVVANPAFKVHITGHSLGGALAGLCAFYMRKDGIFSDAIFYSFGMPRIGNKAWADRFSSWFPEAIRVTHHFDPVARLPPCATTLWPLPKPGCNGGMGPLRYGYHWKGEVYYPNTIFNTYKICNGPEDESCANSAGLNINIQDHLKYLDVDVGGGCSQLRKSL